MGSLQQRNAEKRLRKPGLQRRYLYLAFGAGLAVSLGGAAFWARTLSFRAIPVGSNATVPAVQPAPQESLASPSTFNLVPDLQPSPDAPVASDLQPTPDALTPPTVGPISPADAANLLSLVQGCEDAVARPRSALAQHDVASASTLTKAAQAACRKAAVKVSRFRASAPPSQVQSAVMHTALAPCVQALTAQAAAMRMAGAVLDGDGSPLAIENARRAQADAEQQHLACTASLSQASQSQASQSQASQMGG